LGDLGIDGVGNTKIDLKEIGCKDVDWDRVQWQACVGVVINLWVSQKGEGFLGELSDC
jgi:hypothetical protein